MVFSVRSVGKDGRFDGYNNILGYSVLLFCKLPSDAQISTEGAVKGKFTINDYGDQVYFSKGNLQYADGSWQFAANQWEYFGTDQRDGHRDLFGWGTKDSPDKVSGNNGDYSWAEWGDNNINRTKKPSNNRRNEQNKSPFQKLGFLRGMEKIHTSKR